LGNGISPAFRRGKAERVLEQHTGERLATPAVGRLRPSGASVGVRWDKPRGEFRPLWIWPTLLSLDAPLLAVLWQLLWQRSLGESLAPEVAATTACVVWLIYVADRIFDSFHEDEQALPLRHRFYRRYRALFFAPFAAVFAITGWLAWNRLDPQIRRGGVVLMLLIAGYFAAVHLLGKSRRRWFPKEFVVAVFFGLGVCLPVMVGLGAHTISSALPILLFILLLWMNAVFIEYSEWKALGQADPLHRSSLLIGRHFPISVAAIGVVIAFACTSPALRDVWPILAAEGLSALALLGLYAGRRNASLTTLRAAADAALLTPALVFFFIHL